MLVRKLPRNQDKSLVTSVSSEHRSVLMPILGTLDRTEFTQLMHYKRLLLFALVIIHSTHMTPLNSQGIYCLIL